MKIMWNAGHGADTAGKRSPDGTVREWRVNDKIVDELLILAKQYENLESRRADDPDGSTDVPLATRVDMANSWPADLYVSIHNNAFGSGWNTADGVETYSYNAESKESTALAKVVQAEIIRQTGADNRGQKFANFQELRSTKMPAILVECGFMTNLQDVAQMKTSSWPKQMAKAIMDGIAKYYGLKKKATTAPAPKPVAKPASVPAPKPVSGDQVHRVIVDGKQIGAYQSNASIGEQVIKALANNPRNITIELVK